MDRDELIQFLRDNLKLKIEVEPDQYYGNTRKIEVSLSLDGEEICDAEAEFDISDSIQHEDY